MSATVTVWRGHRRTLFFLSGIIFLFIMCVGIIWSNSVVGGHARAEVWTTALQRVTLYCTWRPNALTTRLHGQVLMYTSRTFKFFRLTDIKFSSVPNQVKISILISVFYAFVTRLSPVVPFVRSFVRSSGQILLLRYLMNGLKNFDKTVQEYSSALIDDRIGF